MRYSLDLSVFPVGEYKELLKRPNLLPGRRILWEEIDRRFEAIERQGVANVMQLGKELSTPRKRSAFAEATGIPESYLIMLRREMGSLEQKTVPIGDFLGMDGKLVSQLNSRGIKNSREYFEGGFSGPDELFCLCDLVRINGVGALAAKAFYEAGYRSVKEVAQAEAAVMLKKVSEANEAKGYYQAKLGEKDMQFCIDSAALLVRYCE